MASRALEETLARIDDIRERKPRLSVITDGKGRPPPRARPDDFEIIFIEIGRLNCETFYRASRITINRWLDETPGDIHEGKRRTGKERLIDLRAKFVEHQRKTLGPLREHVRKGPKEQPKAKRPPRVIERRETRKISLCLAKHAAHYLRRPCNGGWIVSPTESGEWLVGRMRMSAGSMLDLAQSKGFDVETANLSCEIDE